jgi:uncharacterized membrane protein YkvA (DUF1232 family)
LKPESRTAVEWHVKRLARLPWKAILPVLAGVAYGLSPVDLILDVIPLLGFADDVTVLLVALATAVIQFVRWRRIRRSDLPVIESRLAA